MNVQQPNQTQTREPVGSETIACFATAPKRRDVPDAVRQIVCAAIAAAKANSKRRD